jgi:hypothetical protein
MKSAVGVALISFMTASAQNYTAQRVQVDGIEVVRLSDKAQNVEVSIVPSIGNTAYEMKVNGTNVFWFPAPSLGAYKEKPVFSGNPFLAPWANRLDHDGFHANGKHYTLDKNLRNYRSDAHGQPIHGLLTYAKEWQVADLSADAGKAEARSRLEFWRYPDYMAQFPFAHTIDMISRRSRCRCLSAITRTSRFTMRRAISGRSRCPQRNPSSCHLSSSRPVRLSRCRTRVRLLWPASRSMT